MPKFDDTDLRINEGERLVALVKEVYEMIPPEWEHNLDRIEHELNEIGAPINPELRRIKRRKDTEDE